MKTMPMMPLFAVAGIVPDCMKVSEVVKPLTRVLIALRPRVTAVPPVDRLAPESPVVANPGSWSSCWSKW